MNGYSICPLTSCGFTPFSLTLTKITPAEIRFSSVNALAAWLWTTEENEMVGMLLSVPKDVSPGVVYINTAVAAW